MPSYDTLGRMTRVDQTGQTGGNTVAPKRVDFEYNAVGDFSKITRYKDLAGGSTHEVATSTFGRDALGRLTSLDHKKGAANIANYTWQFDTLNRVTQFVSPDGTTNYSYDATSQIILADHSYQVDESLVQDLNGNRALAGYTTGDDNRLTSDGTYNYEYDAEGNRTRRVKISDSTSTEYEWDHRNRLTLVTDKNASGVSIKTVAFAYDVFDRRIVKIYDADGAGSGGTVTSYWVYDGEDIVLAFNGSGAITNRYLHGPAVDQVMADEQVTGGTGGILWILPDNQGTVRDLVDSTGMVQNHIKYDTYGKVTAESNGAINHLYGYSGRERDEETGLNYHRARWFDPITGRWLSQDPIGFEAGDTNLYRYVFNGPTLYVDPSGLDASADWGKSSGNAPVGATGDDVRSSHIANIARAFEITGNLYGTQTVNLVDMVDEFFAGYANGLTLGIVTQIRAGLYGQIATQNHSGTLFEVGDLVGAFHRDVIIGAATGGMTTVMAGGGLGAAIANGAAGGVAGYVITVGGAYIVSGGQTPPPTITGAMTAAASGALMGGLLHGLGAVTPANPAGSNCFVAGTLVIMGSAEARLGGIQLITTIADPAPYERGFLSVALVGLALVLSEQKVVSKEKRRFQGRRAEAGGRKYEAEVDSDQLLLDDGPLPLVMPRRCDGAPSPKCVASEAQPTDPPLGFRSRKRSIRALLAVACVLLAAYCGFTALRTRGESHPFGTASSAVASKLSDSTNRLKDHAKAIELIRVGDRVAANNPEGAEQEITGDSNVNSHTWRLIKLRAEMPWPDGTRDVLEVETLQPPEWLSKHSVLVGAEVPVPLDLAEMLLPEDLKAIVTAIAPCPEIASGPGSVVLTTVNHLNTFVLELAVENPAGKQETIRPTAPHRFYSETRGEWVAAKDLTEGETIGGLDDRVVVRSIKRLRGVHPVYNLTVEGEHVYYVSSLGVLTHNNYGTPIHAATINGNTVSLGKQLTQKQAIARLRRGQNVHTQSAKTAKQLQNKASGGAVHDPAHGAGYYRHYHGKHRGTGHAFYGDPIE